MEVGHEVRKGKRVRGGASCIQVVSVPGQPGGTGVCWRVGLMASPSIIPWPGLLARPVSAESCFLVLSLPIPGFILAPPHLCTTTC